MRRSGIIFNRMMAAGMAAVLMFTSLPQYAFGAQPQDDADMEEVTEAAIEEMQSGAGDTVDADVQSIDADAGQTGDGTYAGTVQAAGETFAGSTQSGKAAGEDASDGINDEDASYGILAEAEAEGNGSALSGEGTADSPYLISGADDWYKFTNDINTGKNTGAYYRLTADISVNEGDNKGLIQAGTDKNRFRGTLDGDGYTLEITGYNNYGQGQGTTVFGYIEDASIRDLKVTGRVTTTDQYGAGLSLYSHGECTVSGCEVDVTILPYANIVYNLGGFIGKNLGTIAFDKCIFGGSIVKNGSNYTPECCGGFVGDNQGSISYTDCVQKGFFELRNEEGSDTFNCGLPASYLRTYYARYCGNTSPEARMIFDEAPGDGITKPVTTVDGVTSDGKFRIQDKNCYSEVAVDIYGVNSIYDHTGEEIDIVPSVYFDGEPVAEDEEYTFAISPQTVKNTGDYTLTISAKDGSGYYGRFLNTISVLDSLSTDANGTYLIGSTEDWDIFTASIANGKTYAGQRVKLTEDIEGITTMAGNGKAAVKKYFSGNFDGGGHTISANIPHSNTSIQGTAPFACIKNATVKNLKVSGTIEANSYYAGGVVGFAEGRNTIEKCTVTADIKLYSNSAGRAGGILGYGTDSVTTIKDCVFAGSIIGVDAACNNIGGIWGWSDNASPALIGCLENGFYVNIGSMHPIGLQGNTGTVRDCYYRNEQTGNPDNACTLGGAQMIYDTAPSGYKTDTVTAPDGNTYYVITGVTDTVVIENEDDWNKFAENVSKGYSYRDVTVILMDYITVSTMVGTKTNRFNGTFDGQGCCLTFNHEANADYTAPFEYIEDAVIKDLTVNGTITTSYKYAAGIAAHSYGSCTFNGCRSEINIKSSVDGAAFHSGFVSRCESGLLDFENCIFKGEINSESTKNCAGFVGWRERGSISYTDCLQDGGFVTENDPSHSNYCDTFNLNEGGIYTRTYYTNKWDTADPAAIWIDKDQPDDSGVLSEKIELFDSKYYLPVDVEISGIDRNYVYTGNALEAAPEVTFNGKAVTEGTDYTFSTSPAEIKNTGRYDIIINGLDQNGYYGQRTFEDVFRVIDANINTPSYNAVSDAYLIENADDWKTFANSINIGKKTYAGQTIKLTDDISITGGYEAVAGSYGNWIDECIPFEGTFEGDGHTITVNLTNGTAKKHGLAPFRYIRNAVIRNLKVAGSIKAEAADVRYLGGVAGFADGANTIEGCVVTASISQKDEHAGGILGSGNASSTTIRDCVFAGSISSADDSEQKNMGGIVSECDPGASITLINCLERGTYENISSMHPMGLFGDMGTITNCYYLNGQKGDPEQACTVPGARQVYEKTEDAPDGMIVKMRKFADGSEYYCPCDVSGIEKEYACTGSEINIEPLVLSPAGKSLKKDVDYTVSTTPAVVKEAGDYTLTVTGIDSAGCYGSQTFSFLLHGDTPYLDENGDVRVKRYGDDTVFLTSEDTYWCGGNYYIADRDVTIDSRIRVEGRATLILCDGATLTTPYGISVGVGDTLIITGQSEGIGKLVAECSQDLGGKTRNAAIGGENDNVENGDGTVDKGACGTIVINGGDIRALGEFRAAGIGGASCGSAGNITINGGRIYAEGGHSVSGYSSWPGAGIGGGYNCKHGEGCITINGGRITAASGEGKGASGIGNGAPKPGFDDTKDQTVHLGWSVSGDFINTDSISGRIFFEDDFVLDKDGVTPATASNMAGRKIVPALRVTFEPENGTGSTSLLLAGNRDRMVSRPHDPAYAGYTFGGWYTSKAYNAAFDFDSPVNGNVVLYAKWNKVGRYGVSFDTGGGTVIPAQYVTQGGLCESPEDPVLAGYSFDKWYSDAACSEPFDFSTGIEGDTVLYAGWRANTCTVKFDPGYPDATGTMEDQVFSYGEGAGALRRNEFTRRGYAFAGWNTDSQGRGTTYADGDELVCSCETQDTTLTLYARWKLISYNITYVMNGGVNDVSNPLRYTVNSDTIILRSPTHISLPFGGWFDNPGMSGEPVTRIEAGSIEDVTLYACWGFSAGDVAVSGNLIYDGAEKHPDVTVRVGNKVLTKDTDYTVVFPDKIIHAGAYEVIVTGAGKYESCEAVAPFEVEKRPVTVTGAIAEKKVYDGTTDVRLDCRSVILGGLFSGDMLTVSGDAVFETPDAGEGKKVVITGFTLGGESVSDYAPDPDGSQKVTTADISKRAITLRALDQTVEQGSNITSGLSMLSVSGNSLAAGQAVSAVTLSDSGTDEATDSGTIQIASVTISDEHGADVTKNYDITLEPGVLRVTEVKKPDSSSNESEIGSSSSSGSERESSSSSSEREQSGSSSERESGGSSSAKDENASSSAKDEDESSSAKDDEASNSAKDGDASSSVKDDNASSSVKDDNASSSAKDDEASSSTKDDEASSSAKDDNESSSAKDDEASSSAKDGDASSSVKDDEASGSVKDDEASSSAKDGDTSSSVKDDEASSSAKDDEASSSMKRDDTSSSAKDEEASSSAKDEGASSSAKDVGASSSAKDMDASSSAKDAGSSGSSMASDTTEPVAISVGGKELNVSVTESFTPVLKYTGGKVTPEDAAISMDVSGLEKAAKEALSASGVSQGTDLSALFVTTYKSKNKGDAGEVTFTAKIKFNKKLAKKLGMSKEDIKAMSDAVAALNKALKSRPVKVTVAKADLTKCFEKLEASFNAKGKLKVKSLTINTGGKPHKLKKKEINVIEADPEKSLVTIEGTGKNVEGKVTVKL